MERTDWPVGWDVGADPAGLIPQVLARRAIYPLYQPIVDLATRDLVGVEALARGPAGSPVELPDALFPAAVRAGLLPQLDQLCAARAVEIARDAGEIVPPLLFVNAEPAALNHPLTPDLIAAISSPRPFRIVLEFTERALATHPAALLDIARSVHRGTGALALDDVGAEPLSLAFLPLIEPEVVKLDMHLLREPHAAATIDTAVTVCAYAERTGAMVLAEGIETEDDLATAQGLGARWGQGWLFGHPGPLSALAGRPVHRYARLRPPRPDLHVPSGTPFSRASMRHLARSGGRRTADGLTGHLMSLAAHAGPHAVVLGAFPDPVVGASWLPSLTAVAGTAAFVGIVGPALAGADPHLVRVAAAPAAGPADMETVLVVVGPHATAALCARPGPGDSLEFVLTHDPDLVHAMARLLLRRFGAVPERPDAPVADRSSAPVRAIR
jgi:EAL domain-containing protein (putative c-di-GMP-specific phosphodiesterase class I)